MLHLVEAFSDITIVLPELGPGVAIHIVGADGGGSLSSNLHEQLGDEDKDGTDPAASAAIDAVESLVLAHYCAGVDVNSYTYRAGLQTSLATIFDHFD